MLWARPGCCSAATHGCKGAGPRTASASVCLACEPGALSASSGLSPPGDREDGSPERHSRVYRREVTYRQELVRRRRAGTLRGTVTCRTRQQGAGERAGLPRLWRCCWQQGRDWQRRRLVRPLRRRSRSTPPRELIPASCLTPAISIRSRGQAIRLAASYLSCLRLAQPRRADPGRRRPMSSAARAAGPRGSTRPKASGRQT